MTVSCRPTSSPGAPHVAVAEPLLQSVRDYLAAPSPNTCHVDIAPDTARDEIKGVNFEPVARNDLNNNAKDAAAAMPSAAELLQRQPLLARTPKPDAHTDESDPDAEHDQRNNDFIVDIPNGAPREERYPKEIWKTIVSFFFLFICVCVNMMSLSLVHERLPDRNTTKRLPDIFLDNIAAREWSLNASEYLIMFSTTVAMIVVVFHKHRFIVSRRLFFIIGLLYLYRSITMFVTVLPVSSETYFCSPKSNGTTPLLVLKRTFYLISGFGLSINGKHTYCGDYMYSGHTMVLVLSYLIVAEYSPRKLWPVQWSLWASAAVGVSFVLLAHAHYCVDVIVAYYVTTRLFWSFHAALAPARAGDWTRREWWAPVVSYLERNVRGPVPRRYDWPLPWPLPWPRKPGRPS